MYVHAHGYTIHANTQPSTPTLHVVVGSVYVLNGGGGRGAGIPKLNEMYISNTPC